MKGIIYNLQEDNKSILHLIQYVDSKIVEVRNNTKLSQQAINDLQELYINTVNLWMESNYLPDIEPDPRWENEIQDVLFDVISYLDSL
jgi:hypothetical protein